MNRNWNTDWRKSIIILSGGFDPIHKGHVRMFESAKDFGEVFVGLNSDESIKRLKGPTRPKVSQKDRLRILSSIKFVDIAQFLL